MSGFRNFGSSHPGTRWKYDVVNRTGRDLPGPLDMTPFKPQKGDFKGNISFYGGSIVHLTPSIPRWGEPIQHQLPTRRQLDLSRRIMERRNLDQGRILNEQARARDRSRQILQDLQKKFVQNRQREQQTRQIIQRNQQTQQRQRELERNRQRELQTRLANQRARQNVDKMLNYHRSFGRRWMAERGPFGLSMGMYPIAKYGGKVLGKVLEAGGYRGMTVSPIGGNALLLGAHKINQAVKEIEQYQANLERQRAGQEARLRNMDDVGNVTDKSLKTRIMGRLTKQDRMVKKIAKAFDYRLQEQQLSNPGMSRQQVSSQAHRIVQEVDVSKISKKYGVKPHRVQAEPISGATGPGGGQIRYDLGIDGRRATRIELKSSGYTSSRTPGQLQAHLIGVGEKTATYGKKGDYYRIYADEGRIDKYTYEDIVRHLKKQQKPKVMSRSYRVKVPIFRR